MITDKDTYTSVMTLTGSFTLRVNHVSYQDPKTGVPKTFEFMNLGWIQLCLLWDMSISKNYNISFSSLASAIHSMLGHKAYKICPPLSLIASITWQIRSNTVVTAHTEAWRYQLTLHKPHAVKKTSVHAEQQLRGHFSW